MKKIIIPVVISVLFLFKANGQQTPSAKNDVTTPLHAMKLDYPCAIWCTIERKCKSRS